MQTITSKDLQEKLKRKEPLIIVDVREDWEYIEGHIPGSKNIPVSRVLFSGADKMMPKNKFIVTVCAHGVRSEKAREALAKRGYNVASLEGGMAEWKGKVE